MLQYFTLWQLTLASILYIASTVLMFLSFLHFSNLTRPLKQFSELVDISQRAKMELERTLTAKEKEKLAQKLGHRLITLEELEKIENVAKSVWVFSHALSQDERWKDKIYQKVKDGCQYSYFIPPKGESMAEDQFERLVKYWKEKAQKEKVNFRNENGGGETRIEIGKGLIKKYIVNPHCFLVTVLVYDASANTPKIVIKLPSDLPEELYSWAIRLDPAIDRDDRDAVRNIISCINRFTTLKCTELKDKYGVKYD